MRTTLTIDDVLVAAKAIARQQGRNLGEVMSDLARSSLQREKAGVSRNGFPLLPVKLDAVPVTFDIVDVLRDES